jgi:hypothetical protein
MKKPIWLLLALYLVAISLACVFASGCTHTKDIEKTATTDYSSYIDSLVTANNDKEVLISNLKNTIDQYNFTDVQFDTKCDELIAKMETELQKSKGEGQIASYISAKTIDSILTELKSMRNKVKVSADGSLEAEGFVKNLRQTNHKLQEMLTQVSVEKEIWKTQAEINKGTKQVITEKKIKHVKDTFLNFWWLYLLGIATGIILWAKFGNKIKSIFISKP